MTSQEGLDGVSRNRPGDPSVGGETRERRRHSPVTISTLSKPQPVTRSAYQHRDTATWSHEFSRFHHLKNRVHALPNASQHITTTRPSQTPDPPVWLDIHWRLTTNGPGSRPGPFVDRETFDSRNSSVSPRRDPSRRESAFYRARQRSVTGQCHRSTARIRLGLRDRKRRREDIAGNRRARRCGVEVRRIQAAVCPEVDQPLRPLHEE